MPNHKNKHSSEPFPVQPTPVADGPTYDDLSKLCSEHGLDVDSWPLEKVDALWEVARAVLARWGHQPAPPAEGEVGELVRQLGVMAVDAEAADFVSDAAKLTRAADLLEQRHPAPAPVSVEREGAND